MRNLRERLEEEHQALLTREQDKAALELRIARLTKLILHSTRMNTSTAAARKQRMSLLRSFSEHMCPTVGNQSKQLKEDVHSCCKACLEGVFGGLHKPHLAQVPCALPTGAKWPVAYIDTRPAALLLVSCASCSLTLLLALQPSDVPCVDWKCWRCVMPLPQFVLVNAAKVPTVIEES